MNTITFAPITFAFTFSLFGACASRADLSRNEEGLTALHVAAGRGQADRVAQLLRTGADVHALDSRMGVSALHKAAYSGDARTVTQLLDAGARIDLASPSNGNTPLHDALYFRMGHDLSVIRTLLARGAGLGIRNRAGFVALESAEILKDTEAAALIRAELARRHGQAGQALMEAVKSNDEAKVTALLAAPETPLEESDEQGFTPLLWSARQGQVSITRRLLARGADPNHLDVWMGATAGHKAGFWGRHEVLRLLLAHGLEIDARGHYNGYTALHDAVAQGHVETIRVLLKAGARKDVEGHDGQTPESLGRQSKNVEVRRLLLSSNGAK